MWIFCRLLSSALVYPKLKTEADLIRKVDNTIRVSHVEEIESLLLANYPLTRVQLDAMWREKVDISKNLTKASPAGALP